MVQLVDDHRTRRSQRVLAVHLQPTDRGIATYTRGSVSYESTRTRITFENNIDPLGFNLFAILRLNDGRSPRNFTRNSQGCSRRANLSAMLRKVSRRMRTARS